MSDYEHSVFISYAWGGEREEIVNQIDQALQARGIKIVRDKRDLGYRGSISEFMERIGQGNCVVVVISDKYLRSPNCMFELVEIADGKQFHDRIFPIVLSDANIYDPIRRIEYVKYWEVKRAELAEAIRTLDPANLQGIREDMDLYDRIRDKISGLTSILKDMNTLTPDMHRESDFREIYDGIENRMKAAPATAAGEAPAPAREAARPVENARSGGGHTDPSPPAPSQNINFGGTAQFGGPVQFGNNQNVQNIYYAAPDQSKSPDLSGTIDVEYFEPETLYIPAGAFMMGSIPGEGIPQHETPQNEVILPAYRIGKYPVTNMQYEVFIHETSGQAPQSKSWEGKKVREGMENYPVTGILWQEARAYCDWLSTKTGRQYSLPNEAQWEKACRGGCEAKYPWGDELDSTRSNHGKPQLAPVDAYSAQNDYGLFDLLGNIRQWTTTLWGKKLVAPDPVYTYPWKMDGRDDLNASRQLRRVIRGTSFAEDVRYLRCSIRNGQLPEDAGWTGAGIGFRVAMSI